MSHKFVHRFTLSVEFLSDVSMESASAFFALLSASKQALEIDIPPLKNPMLSLSYIKFLFQGVRCPWWPVPASGE